MKKIFGRKKIKNVLLYCAALTLFTVGLMVAPRAFAQTVLPTPTAPTFSNPGVTTLTVNWTAVSGATSYKLERMQGTSWVQIASTAATSFNDSGLEAGVTYYYHVKALNSSSESLFSDKGVAQTLTTAPAFVSFSGVATSTLGLIWGPSPFHAYYSVERSTDGATFVQIAAPFMESWVDKGLSPGTKYYYKIRARNSAGFSAYSPTVSITTVALVVAPLAPGIPTYANVASTTLAINWTAATGATSYRLERSPSGADGTFVQIASPVGTTYTDSGLAPSTTYYYKVKGNNSAGDGSYSPASSVKTAEAGVAPSVPGTPTYSNIASTTLTVNWTSATGADSYKLERSIDGSSFIEIANPSATTFADSGLTPSSPYYYRVRGYNSAVGKGDPSASSSVTTVVANASPGSPSQDSPLANATGVSTTARFFMSAIDPESDTLKYKVTIYSNAICTNIIEVNDQTVSATGWSAASYTSGVQAAYTAQTHLATSTTYYWRASAIDTSGSNTWVDSVTCNNFTTISAPPAPLAPTYANIASTTITINWAAVSAADSYILERSANGTTFVQIASAAGTTYNDSGLIASTTYYYRVRGYNAAGDGVNSPSSSVKTAAVDLPVRPGTPSYSNISTSTLTISWAAAAGATSYKLQRSSNGTSFTQIASISSNAYGDMGLTADTTYYYRVLGHNDSGDGLPSPSSSVVMEPLMPPSCNLTSEDITITIPPPRNVTLKLNCAGEVSSCSITSVDAYNTTNTYDIGTPDSWSPTPAPTSSTKYTLNCSGSEGESTSTVSIRVINLDIKETVR